MNAAIALAGAWLAHAAGVPSLISPRRTALSTHSLRIVARMHEGLASTQTGRRLLAQTARVQRLEIANAGSPVAYLRGAPGSLAFDPVRLRALPAWSGELVLARELARAALELPVDLVEEDLMVHRVAMEYALEREGKDPGFGKAIRRLGPLMERRLQLQLSLDPRRRPLVPLPRQELERLAYLMILLARDPDVCDWAIESGLPRGPEVARLAEVEDFWERYHGELAGLGVPDGVPYVRLGGRRYPAALARAAAWTAESGGLGRLQSAFADLGPEPTALLRRRVAAFMGIPLAKP